MIHIAVDPPSAKVLMLRGVRNSGATGNSVGRKVAGAEQTEPRLVKEGGTRMGKAWPYNIHRRQGEDGILTDVGRQLRAGAGRGAAQGGTVRDVRALLSVLRKKFSAMGEMRVLLKRTMARVMATRSRITERTLRHRALSKSAIHSTLQRGSRAARWAEPARAELSERPVCAGEGRGVAVGVGEQIQAGDVSMCAVGAYLRRGRCVQVDLHGEDRVYLEGLANELEPTLELGGDARRWREGDIGSVTTTEATMDGDAETTAASYVLLSHRLPESSSAAPRARHINAAARASCQRHALIRAACDDIQPAGMLPVERQWRVELPAQIIATAVGEECPTEPPPLVVARIEKRSEEDDPMGSKFPDIHGVEWRVLRS
ncbi:hypothetical protein DFH07DRAFT_779620 [Mycena maculata]|uniref:Uncharacterized protein n=1 Tax=Mycena maculata TaxID=230809 RepID=A0AAD7MYL7_9AGAR|nr:hypothetical protein DFH07DRAFT_779620 [Mycena maculata]